MKDKKTAKSDKTEAKAGSAKQPQPQALADADLDTVAGGMRPPKPIIIIGG